MSGERKHSEESLKTLGILRSFEGESKHAPLYDIVKQGTEANLLWMLSEDSTAANVLMLTVICKPKDSDQWLPASRAVRFHHTSKGWHYEKQSAEESKKAVGDEKADAPEPLTAENAVDEIKKLIFYISTLDLLTILPEYADIKDAFLDARFSPYLRILATKPEEMALNNILNPVIKGITKPAILFDKIKELFPPEFHDNLIRFYDELDPDDRLKKYKEILKIGYLYCKDLPFPEELSSTALAIKQEKEKFSEVQSDEMYEDLVYLIQTIMIARMCVNKLGGKFISEITDQHKEAIIVTTDAHHSLIYSISQNENLNFTAEADESHLAPDICEYTRDDCIKSFNENQNAYTKSYIINVTHEELLEAYRSVEKFPNKNFAGEKTGWGNHLYNGHIPSHRNCHAFVYTTLYHLMMKRELTKTATVHPALTSKAVASHYAFFPAHGKSGQPASDASKTPPSPSSRHKL